MFHMPDDPDNLVFLQELLNENRKKGFPSDINSLFPGVGIISVRGTLSGSAFISALPNHRSDWL